MHDRTRAILMIAVSVVVSVACGSQYSISAWSTTLKHELNCTQSDIEMVGTLGNVGAQLGPIMGTLVAALPEIWVAIICGVGGLVGFMPMALAVKYNTGFWSNFRDTRVLGCLWGIGGFCAGTLFSLVMTVNLSNVPVHRRGSLVAFLMLLFGLSAAIYTGMYNGPLDSNVAHFLFFLGSFMLISCFIAGALIRRLDPVTTWEDGSGLDDVLLLSQAHESSTDLTRKVSNAYLAQSENDVYATLSDVPRILTDEEAEEEADEMAWRLLDEQVLEQTAYQQRICGGGLLGRFFGPLAYMVRTVDYWLIIVCVFLTAGAGLMMINNTGHIVQSLNGGKQDGSFTTFLIFMLSIANGFGRLSMGISDFVKWRKGVWLVLMCLLMSLTHFANAFLFTKKEHVVAGVMGAAWAYGGMWSITFIIMGDRYGMPHFATNIGWVSWIAGPASVFFNSIAGKFYDDQATHGTHECVGHLCYRDSFIMCGCSAAVGCLLALVLLRRTSRGMRKRRTA